MFKPVTSRLDTQIEATKKLENKGVREGDPLPEYPIEPEDGGDEMPNFEPPPPIDEDEMPNFEPPPPIDEDEMPNFEPPPPIDEDEMPNFEPPPPIDEDEMPNFEPPPPIDEDETEDEGEMPDFDLPPSIERKRKKWATTADQKELDRQRESLAEERRQSSVCWDKTKLPILGSFWPQVWPFIYITVTERSHYKNIKSINPAKVRGKPPQPARGMSARAPPPEPKQHKQGKLSRSND
ncbi:hypothetical protein ACROYT_G010209 [Oculina patagonica]